MLKAILFDLDETLMDWSGRIPVWPNHEYKRLSGVYEYFHNSGYELGEEQFFYDTVIERLVDLWNDSRSTLLAPHFGHMLLSVLKEQGIPESFLDMDACLQAYRYDLVPGVKIYPEVPQVLADLTQKGLQLGIVTNSLQPMKLRDIELTELELLSYFEEPYRISAADVGYLKPHPRIFEEALTRMGVYPNEAVFVGDNLRADIAGAQGVGMKAIWRRQPQNLPRKSPPPDQPVIPDAELDDLTQLAGALDQLFPNWQG